MAGMGTDFDNGYAPPIGNGSGVLHRWRKDLTSHGKGSLGAAAAIFASIGCVANPAADTLALGAAAFARARGERQSARWRRDEQQQLDDECDIFEFLGATCSHLKSHLRSYA